MHSSWAGGQVWFHDSEENLFKWAWSRIIFSGCWGSYVRSTGCLKAMQPQCWQVHFSLERVTGAVAHSFTGCVFSRVCAAEMSFLLPLPDHRWTWPLHHQTYTFFGGGGKLNGNDVRYTKCTVSVRLSKCLQLEIIQKNLKEKEVQISVKSMGLLAPKFCGIL